ncbi:PHP domain-containing protein [Natronospora cellulosivora (SeqCode)]
MSEYKIELHAHSSETSPCGMIEAKELVKMYKDANYQALVMTDHYYDRFFEMVDWLSWQEKMDNYLVGYREAKEMGEKVGLTVLLGIEITFQENTNDYLVFGLDEKFLRDIPELYKYTLKEFRELSREEDILIYHAHPYRKGNKPAPADLLDGLEVYNGNPRHQSFNQLAEEYAKRYKMKMISGSDFHQKEDLARGGIIAKEKVSNMAELLKLLKSDEYKLIK